MAEVNSNIWLIAGAGLAIFCIAQVFATIWMSASLRSANRERAQLAKELFGLVRKLEGLTSSKREQMLKHYDQILESLSVRLPTTIAAHASQTIFDTESKILARLAELEPALKTDEGARKKMDELIRSMENLEQTLICLTADAVKKVMVDSRRDLLDEDKYLDPTTLAN